MSTKVRQSGQWRRIDGVSAAALAALGVYVPVTVTLTQPDMELLDSQPFVLVAPLGDGKIAWPKWLTFAIEKNGASAAFMPEFGSNSGVWWNDVVDFDNQNLVQFLFDSLFDTDADADGMTAGPGTQIPSANFRCMAVEGPYLPAPAIIANSPLVLKTNGAVTFPEIGGAIDDSQITTLANGAGGSAYQVGDTFTVDPSLPDFAPVPVAGVVDSVRAGGPAGAIVTSVLNSGGSGYAPGDTGVCTSGAADAAYVVDTVSGGAVVTYHFANAGTAYSPTEGAGTETGGAQPGVGSGFTINITAVGGEVLTYHFTSVPDFGYVVGYVSTTATSGSGNGLGLDVTSVVPGVNPVTVTVQTEYAVYTLP